MISQSGLAALARGAILSPFTQQQAAAGVAPGTRPST
jgi:hypothetical protein